MRVLRIKSLLFATLAIVIFAASPCFAQSIFKSQEPADDGIPVLIKHLPDWESKKDSIVFANKPSDLQKVFGNHAVTKQISFIAATEAAGAVYDEGKLLVVEYSSPQLSVEEDAKFQQFLAQDAGNPPVIYKRVGNYSVFVFDAADAEKGNALLEKVKYQKTAQWLGQDPYAQFRQERQWISETTDLFVYTVLFILLILLIAIVFGVLCGYVYFRYRQNQRSRYTQFSDAGGMTRLNLDGFTPDIEVENN